MPDHTIRLRGAWDCTIREGGSEVVRRVDLPTDWPAGTASRFRLRRWFGRPPLDLVRESARLEMQGVPGLVVARLNNSELAGPGLGEADWSVPLPDSLRSRNELVLEVDLGSLPGPWMSWGAIALVISSRPGFPE